MAYQETEMHYPDRNIIELQGILGSLYTAWLNHITRFAPTPDPNTDSPTEVYLKKPEQAITEFVEKLKTGNGVVLLHHVSIVDALPSLGWLISQLQDKEVIIPYAIHIDTGLDPNGDTNLYWTLRKLLAHKFFNTITNYRPQFRFMPVSRAHFENKNQKLKK